MDTIEFLWRYQFAHLEPEDIEAWAVGQLLEGSDVPAVLEMACNPGMHWEDRARCMWEVREAMSLQPFLDDGGMPLLLAKEERYIKAYLAGESSAEDLIWQGYDLWCQSDYADTFMVWCGLAEDLGTLAYESADWLCLLSPEDMDGSLKDVLIRNGKIEGDPHGQTPEDPKTPKQGATGDDSPERGDTKQKRPGLLQLLVRRCRAWRR